MRLLLLSYGRLRRFPVQRLLGSHREARGHRVIGPPHSVVLGSPSSLLVYGALASRLIDTSHALGGEGATPRAWDFICSKVHASSDTVIVGGVTGGRREDHLHLNVG